MIRFVCIFFSGVIYNIQQGLSLSCVQCSNSESPSCQVSPPNPSTCNPEANYCLTLKEYTPSRQDDADANLDDSAGKLIFLARTCVQENAGDSCSTGMKGDTAVTVCRQHCRTDGCNQAVMCRIQPWLIIFTILLITGPIE